MTFGTRLDAGGFADRRSRVNRTSITTRILRMRRAPQPKRRRVPHSSVPAEDTCLSSALPRMERPAGRSLPLLLSRTFARDRSDCASSDSSADLAMNAGQHVNTRTHRMDEMPTHTRLMPEVADIRSDARHDWLAQFFSRATRRAGQVRCGLSGHCVLLRFEPRRLSLHCSLCGYESPGWDIGPRARAVFLCSRSRSRRRLRRDIRRRAARGRRASGRGRVFCATPAPGFVSPEQRYEVCSPPRHLGSSGTGCAIKLEP